MGSTPGRSTTQHETASTSPTPAPLSGRCPHCGFEITIPPEQQRDLAAGIKVTCKGCGRILDVARPKA